MKHASIGSNGTQKKWTGDLEQDFLIYTDDYNHKTSYYSFNIDKRHFKWVSSVCSLQILTDPLSP